MKRWLRDWRQVRNILAVRLDSMGDVLMTTPAWRALKETFPGSRVTLLTSAVGSRVTPYIPEIDHVKTFEAPWVKTYQGVANAKSVQAMVRELKSEGYDAAIIFTVYSQNPLPAAMMLYLAEIPLRLGYSQHNPYHLLTHWVPDPEPGRFIRHEVKRQLDLVATVGAWTERQSLSFTVAAADRRRVRSRLQALGITPENAEWLIVHPGAREERRCYPADKYIQALRLLTDRWPGKLVVTGSRGERELVDTITTAVGEESVPLAGRLSLGEMGALIAEAPLLVANNTGPVHVAAAVGTPVVDIYARTNPQHTPWKVPHRLLPFDVPCRDCERRVCRLTIHPSPKEVTPREVSAAVMELLAAKRVPERVV